MYDTINLWLPMLFCSGTSAHTSYYQKMIDGGFDDEVRQLRQQAKEFYQYDRLVL
jgi:hypothetical protein